MIFIFRKWDYFCKSLKEKGIISIIAKDVDNTRFVVLKHDVETNVKKAFKMAKIEHKYGHHSSYYVQAYLLKKPKNIKMLQQIQAMGHEVSYHYDVMDSCRGDIDKAILEFESNKELFEQNGFKVVTVCQHGNPLIERIGYTSNRDFFRNEKVQKLYPAIADIMVDFKVKYKTDYLYYSDAGRQFKMIYDPLFNDVNPSSDKDVPYKSFDELLSVINNEGNAIISTHPHRYCSSAFIYVFKSFTFKIIKFVAKLLYKIPFMKKFMSKYYDLAKKI